jgi:hypothetical protein
VALVGQDRERGGTAALVSADLRGDVGICGGDFTGARRASLELGDQGEARAGEGLVERPILAADMEARLEVRLGYLAPTLLDALPCSGDQLLDHCHRTRKA